MLAFIALSLSIGVVDAGAGFPSFDVAYERVLAGAAPEAGAVGAGDVKATVHGAFTNGAAGLALAQPAAYGESTWLTSYAVGDGIVRARVLPGAHGDVSVLVRAKAGEDGELEEGYAVTLVDGALKVSRFEHKVPRLLGAETHVGPLRASEPLEVVVLLAGPFISATLYDGTTLAPRAHLEVRDRRARAGAVGVRMGKASDATVTLLSAGASSTAGDALPDDGAGAERLVLLPRDELDRVPKDLRAVDRGDVAAVLTDAVGLERMLRAGVVPTRVSTQVPWKDEDANLRAHLDKPPTPTKTGFRVDESYKSATMVEALLKAYAARFPAVTRLEQIGVTTEGRAMFALAIGKHIDGDVDTVLLDGAHHGGELMSVEFVMDAVQQLLEDPAHAPMLEGLTVWCVPLVNVDGNMRYVHETRDYDRKNGRDIDDNGKVDGWDGVDLYRNYPADWGGLGEVGSRSNPYHYRYRGPKAASEPEPQAMMALAQRERFTSSIDFHTNATAILVPYTDPNMASPELNEAWGIAEDIARTLPVQITGKRYRVLRNLYPVDGTYQDWLRLSFGTVALLVEGPENNPLPYVKHRDGAVAGTRGTWLGLLERTLAGPGIVGHVRDADGKPLEAQVSVDEQRLHMNEVWTARPRDGRFHRLLPKGEYTLRVKAPGYAEKTARVVVGGDKSAVVDVVLARE